MWNSDLKSNTLNKAFLLLFLFAFTKNSKHQLTSPTQSRPCFTLQPHLSHSLWHPPSPPAPCSPHSMLQPQWTYLVPSSLSSSHHEIVSYSSSRPQLKLLRCPVRSLPGDMLLTCRGNFGFLGCHCSRLESRESNQSSPRRYCRPFHYLEPILPIFFEE